MQLRTAYGLLLLTVRCASSKKNYEFSEDPNRSANQELHKVQESENEEDFEDLDSSAGLDLDMGPNFHKHQESENKSKEVVFSGHHEFINDKHSYDGAQVWRCRLRNSDDGQLINTLLEERAISPWMTKLSIVDFLVAPSQKDEVARILRAYSLNRTVLIKNVGDLRALRQLPPPAWTNDTLRLGHRYNYNHYPPLEVIEEYLSYIGHAYSSICTVKTVGHSVENRAIKMVVVSNGNQNNKGILLTDGSHAREWVAVSSLLYVLTELLTKFDSQPDFVRDKTWYIIPVSNPDGYDFTHKENRLWRKNRRKFQNCVGVDLNRNFGYSWNIPGVSQQDQCSDVYSGHSPFSEPETVAMSSVLTATKNLAAVCSVHCYGQMVLYPWAAKSEPTPDREKHSRIAEEMTMAMFNTDRKSYTYGFAYHKVKPVSGTFMDYVYASGYPLSFTIEARDTGKAGFLLPEDQIVPTGREIQAAVYALSKATGES